MDNLGNLKEPPPYPTLMALQEQHNKVKELLPESPQRFVDWMSKHPACKLWDQTDSQTCAIATYLRANGADYKITVDKNYVFFHDSPPSVGFRFDIRLPQWARRVSQMASSRTTFSTIEVMLTATQPAYKPTARKEKC